MWCHCCKGPIYTGIYKYWKYELKQLQTLISTLLQQSSNAYLNWNHVDKAYYLKRRCFFQQWIATKGINLQIREDIVASRWCQTPWNKRNSGNYDLFCWVSCSKMHAHLKMKEQGGGYEDFNSLLFLWGSQQLRPHLWLNSLNWEAKLHDSISCLSFLQRRSVYWPLDTVREPRTVVWGRGIVSAYSIQEVVVCRHTHSSTPFGHGSTHAPLVGVWIEALHGPQTWAAVPTSYCKQSEKINKMSSKSTIFDINCRYSTVPLLAGITDISCQMFEGMWQIL